MDSSKGNAFSLKWVNTSYHNNQTKSSLSVQFESSQLLLHSMDICSIYATWVALTTSRLTKKSINHFIQK
jgi:hypothetical protein